jgi:Tol biopolymer transport system component
VRFPYSIVTMPVDGGPKTLVAGNDGHLYFGPRWSPDGRSLAFLDCRPKEDPAHYWADLCLANPDGGEHRVVSPGLPHWFGTTHGSAQNRMGGSNMTEWSPDGATITYTRVAAGSHPDARFHPERPDHEENLYSPESARGGAQLCLLDPFRGTVKELTPYEENRWDFRSAWHPSGDRIVHSHAVVTKDTEIWVVNADGSRPRMLTRGFEESGAFGRRLDLGRRRHQREARTTIFPRAYSLPAPPTRAPYTTAFFPWILRHTYCPRSPSSPA